MDKYWINSKGENLGPFTREEISEKVETGEFVLSDPICLVGNEEWLDLGEFLNSDSIIDQKEVEWKDEQKVIVARKSGLSLNVILTTVLFFLLLVCVGLYLFAQFRGNSVETRDEQVDVSFIGDKEIKDIASRAWTKSSFIIADGLMVKRDADLPYTGWIKATYSNSESLSTLVQYEKGKVLLGLSWTPDGVRCSHSSLENGKGILTTYYDTGERQLEESYRSGFLNGLSIRFYKNNQKEEEKSFVNGQLHGQRVSWHNNGQKIEQVFYLEGIKNGPYSLWSKDGQKYDEGVYQNGELDGKRIQWSRNGLERFEETYKNGEKIPDIQVDPLPMVNDLLLDEEVDPVLAKLLELAGEEEDWIRRANDSTGVVNFITARFEKSQISGHEIFADLAIALFDYAKQGINQKEALVDTLSWINNQWGIAIIFEGDGFFVSEIPQSVRFGPITWERSIYENDFMGSLQGESREFVIGDLENLFQSVGLTLGSEKESIKRKVERLIWEDLALRAEETENAKLVFENNQLSYNGTIEQTSKKIDPQGNSIFDTVEKEVLFIFTQQHARDKKLGPFIKVLQDAGVRFEEMRNGNLMIRKYSNLCIYSDQVSQDGAAYIYPEVTIQFAGVAPLGPNTLIRYIKVELGEIIEEPLDLSNEEIE